MSPYLPSSRHGWLYYLSSAFVIGLALVLNLKAYSAVRSMQASANEPEWRDSDFTFIEDDYPPTLIPPTRHPRDAALVIEDTVRYHPNASADWHSLFPEGSGGFVHLGPQERIFGISMYHQLHCLDKMRRAMIATPDEEWERRHLQHCLNYIRQMLLCAASVRLEPVKSAHGTGMEGLKVDGLGLEHQCRDWTLVRREAENNYQRWTTG